ncbi:hypothetical protein ACAG25_06990 [Mycobacterium sp. pV006]|uniref:hypothetical protein n=1 Tax=Mycobacterium sp. pV006 TaxID=3238983 RepID=UPI00351AB6B1
MDTATLARAVVVSAALGLLAPAAAIAAPDDGVWDIGAYDDCMSKTVRNADLCCVESGGVPTADADDTQPDGSPNCYAPPAQGAATAPGIRPVPQRPIVGLPVAPPPPAGIPGGPPPMVLAPG